MAAISFTKWWRLWTSLVGFAIITLWVAGTPIFANSLNSFLESRFPPVSIDKLPRADVVILLGGASETRIRHALQIYRAGKAERIVISGGVPPSNPTAIPEAQQMAQRLVELGVPRSALILETGSRNTRENAVNTAAIFKKRGWQSGLLVTSGAHMPRAVAAFRRVGLNVIPAATDIHAGPVRFSRLVDFLPCPEAFASTMSALREMIGLGVYRYRDWA